MPKMLLTDTKWTTNAARVAAEAGGTMIGRKMTDAEAAAVTAMIEKRPEGPVTMIVGPVAAGMIATTTEAGGATATVTRIAGGRVIETKTVRKGGAGATETKTGALGVGTRIVTTVRKIAAPGVARAMMTGTALTGARAGHRLMRTNGIKS
jgi:hypothetical protein